MWNMERRTGPACDAGAASHVRHLSMQVLHIYFRWNLEVSTPPPPLGGGPLGPALASELSGRGWLGFKRTYTQALTGTTGTTGTCGVQLLVCAVM